MSSCENALLATSLSEAMDCQPVFLLWAASPDFLSDAAMIGFGLAMKASTSAFSPGIITASTLDGARELWQRRIQVRGEHFFAANAPNPAAHLDVGRTVRQVPAGVIPVRITGGASYQFVDAPGVTAAAEQDPFYNSRLQMIDIQDDKYILLVHPGGDLTLRLRSAR